MPKQTPTTPESQAKAAPVPTRKDKKQFSVSPALLTLLCVAGVVGYLAFASWQALTATPAAGGAPLVAATPPVPQLKLNGDNKRSVPDISVDEKAIGKDNPFVK
ncbi:MAG TPA: hypothetical protein VLA04_04905 [Verrucomicrobiae bacterium]|nr:hypothetical protein [Verrucomicrobiae bacterium]